MSARDGYNATLAGLNAAHLSPATKAVIEPYRAAVAKALVALEQSALANDGSFDRTLAAFTAAMDELSRARIVATTQPTR